MSDDNHASSLLDAKSIETYLLDVSWDYKLSIDKQIQLLYEQFPLSVIQTGYTGYIENTDKFTTNVDLNKSLLSCAIVFKTLGSNEKEFTEIFESTCICDDEGRIPNEVVNYSKWLMHIFIIKAPSSVARFYVISHISPIVILNKHFHWMNLILKSWQESINASKLNNNEKESYDSEDYDDEDDDDDDDSRTTLNDPSLYISMLPEYIQCPIEIVIDFSLLFLIEEMPRLTKEQTLSAIEILFKHWIDIVVYKKHPFPLFAFLNGDHRYSIDKWNSLVRSLMLKLCRTSIDGSVTWSENNLFQRLLFQPWISILSSDNKGNSPSNKDDIQMQMDNLSNLSRYISSNLNVIEDMKKYLNSDKILTLSCFGKQNCHATRRALNILSLSYESSETSELSTLTSVILDGLLMWKHLDQTFEFDLAKERFKSSILQWSLSLPFSSKTSQQNQPEWQRRQFKHILTFIEWQTKASQMFMDKKTIISCLDSNCLPTPLFISHVFPVLGNLPSNLSDEKSTLDWLHKNYQLFDCDQFFRVKWSIEGENGHGVGCAKEVLCRVTKFLFESFWTRVDETGFYVTPRISPTDNMIMFFSGLVFNLHMIQHFKFPFPISPYILSRIVKYKDYDYDTKFLIESSRMVDPEVVKNLESLHSMSPTNLKYIDDDPLLSSDKAGDLDKYIQKKCYSLHGREPDIKQFCRTIASGYIYHNPEQKKTCFQLLKKINDPILWDMFVNGSETIPSDNDLWFKILNEEDNHNHTSKRYFDDWINYTATWKEKRRLYTFVTGCQRFNSHTKMKVSFEHGHVVDNGLPKAATCFSILFIGKYDSFELFKQQFNYLLYQADLSTLSLE